MTTRFKVERLIIIAVPCAVVASLAYSTFKSDSEMAIPVIIIGSVSLGMLIRRILKRDTRAVLWMALFAMIWAVVQLAIYVLGRYPHDAAWTLELAAFEAAALLFTCCSGDLWSEWSKPNPPEATPGNRPPLPLSPSSGAPQL